MKKGNKTKIVATIGPASSSKEILTDMISAGMNICRVNFSHGDYTSIKEIINTIRQLNNELSTHIGILADLQGPKLRIGEVKDNRVELLTGKSVLFTTEPCISNGQKIYITYPDFPRDVSVGENILIDDGRLILTVTATNEHNEVEAMVIHGGILSSKKGVNLPNTDISLPCLTEKDIHDLAFALENNVEWIGLSFVRSDNDIYDLKQRINDSGSSARVVAKIEKPEALKLIDKIIMASDAVMVARGDLGVEIPLEHVPHIQKMIVRKCNELTRPVIIATQMMESMITDYSPTRAEVNDVANAVMDGADAVMLSEETSVGKYPVRTVQYMQRIVEQIEMNENSIYYHEHKPSDKELTFISDTVCYNACNMARHASASAITTMTNSGYTGFKLSSYRPKAAIYIFTDNRSLLNSLSLLWGVYGFYYDKYESTDLTISDIEAILKTEGLVAHHDLIISIASAPIRDRGRANLIKLSRVNSSGV